jgi:predicted permease
MHPTIRNALRSLRRAPGLGLAAIACIGLGTAATATVATLVSATLLRPVPFPASDRLVRVWFDEPGVNPRLEISIPDVADFRRMSSFDAFLGVARVRAVALLSAGAERLRGEGVSTGYFETLGVRTSLGRVLTASDHRPDAPPVVVLSHGTWMRHYGSDPTIVGRDLRTERETYTIVGVAQPGFAGTVENDVVEFFIPIEQYEPRSMITARGIHTTWVIARLKQGVAPAAAQAEADSMRRDLAKEFPDIYARWRTRVEPFGESWRQELRAGGSLLFGAAGLLLVIAAINVSCLLLARVIDRRRELAICAALGADRRRLMLQLFTEALVLVAAGGAVGALGGPWLLAGFLAISPVTLPTYLQLEPDLLTVLLAATALGIAGVIAGTAPALIGRRVAPGDVLREGARGTLGRGIERTWGGLLIAGETALTLVLLVAGGLLVRSYERLETLDMGFERDRIARLAITLNRTDIGERTQLPALYERLQRELAAVPGVDRIGLVSPTLPPWDAERVRVRFEGLENDTYERGIEVGSHLVDEGLLPMLGIRLLAGRNLSAGDDDRSAPAAVVSRSVAVRLGGVEEALGREIVVLGEDRAGAPGGAFRVVGVAEDVAWDGLAEQDTRRFIHYADSGDPKAARYDVYLPLARFPQAIVSIGAATSGDPAALIDPLRRRIAAIAPTSAVHWTSTMDDEVALEYAPTRFYTVLVTAFSSGALLLTSIGLFALLSHAAARRTSEIGLRLALGASRASAAGLLLRAGVLPIALGVAGGLLGAIVVGRAMGTLLYGIRSFDTPTFVVAVVALLAVSVAAGLIPARRVARIDPNAALRTE